MPSPTSITTVWNNARTAFLQDVFPIIQDNIFGPHPLMRALFGSLGKGGVDFELMASNFKNFKNMPEERVLRGSKDIQQRVGYQALAGGVQGTGVQVKNNTVTQFMTMAEWPVSWDYQELAIPRDDWQTVKSMIGNGNTAGAGGKIIDLAAQTVEQGFKTLIERNTGFLVGTNVDPEQGMLSFSAGIGNSTTDNTTYGKIVRSSNTWWRGNYATYDDTKVLDPSDGDYMAKVLRGMINTVKNNGASVTDLVFAMGSSAHSAWQETLQGVDTPTTAGDTGTKHRYNTTTGREIPGFDGLFFSQVPIAEEPNLPAWKIILIDMRSTRIVPVAGSIFEIDEWKPMEQATGMFSQIMLGSQLIVTNPRRNFIKIDS